MPALLRRHMPSGRPGEWAGRGFARVTAVPAIGVIAWLLPGLPLLAAGDFAPVPMLLIAAPLVTALAVNVLHRIPGRWPSELPGQAPERGWMSWLGMVGTVAVAAGFTLWQLALTSPSVIATRTPGAAFQTGYWIAQHGSLPIPGSLAAFGGPHPGLHLSSIGFFQQGHVVVPAVPAGLPLLLAGGFWTSGTGGGAVIGPILGGLAVLSFGGLVGRLTGLRWAPAGALALALTLPELYTSRDAFSEPAVQILLFGGLSLVVDALTTGRPDGAGQVAMAGTVTEAGGIAAPRRAVAGSARPTLRRVLSSPAALARRLASWPATLARRLASWPAALVRGVVSLPTRARLMVSSLRNVKWRGLPARAVAALTPELMLAALGGLALGIISLLSLGSLVYLLPAIVVAGVLVVARRAVGVALCLGMCVGSGYGITAGFVLARPLVDSLAPTLEVIGRDAGGAVLLTVAALLLRFESRWLSFVRDTLARRPLRWLPGLGAIVLIGALAWLAVRPYVQTIRAVLGRAEADYIATLQRMAGLKVDPTRLYSEDTLYWVIWYAGLATVLLGGFGAAVLLRRCLRALLTWRDPAGSGLNWALPLAIVLGGCAAILWQPFTVPDQPWASRRLVPVVIPGLILLATWAAAWLTRRATDRGASPVTAAVVGMFCVGAMLLPSVTTSFGVGLSHSGPGGGLRPSAGGLAQHSVAVGEADAVRRLCSAIGRSSSVVIIDRRVAGVFSQVIRGMCGVPVASMGRTASVAQVDAVLVGIGTAGRHAVVLGASPAQVGAFGGPPMLVLHLSTTQYPHTLTQPAGAPWPARYMIWMVVVNSPNVGV